MNRDMLYHFIGWQEFPGGDGTVARLGLYNLDADIPGHPAGSTVSEDTLRGAGIWAGHHG